MRDWFPFGRSMALKPPHRSLQRLIDKIATPADGFARMVVLAISEPENVDVNEILFRPTSQPV